MPIRFRCAYCNQLMGIAKRKAGAVVTCPKCAGQVVVPAPDPAQEEEERRAGGGAAAAFEEDDEVQKLLEYVEEAVQPSPRAQPVAVHRKPPTTPGMAPLATAYPIHVPAPMAAKPLGRADVLLDVIPMDDLPPRGVHFSPAVLAIALALVGLLLGLMFLLGFLLGRSTV